MHFELTTVEAAEAAVAVTVAEVLVTAESLVVFCMALTIALQKTGFDL